MAVSVIRSWILRLRTLIRSSMIGLMATASDLGTLALLVGVFKIDPRVANVPSLLPGLVIMFFGNKFFAFEDRSKQILKQGSYFLLIEFYAFVLNVLLFHFIVTTSPLHYTFARMLGTALTYLGFSFPMWSLLVFQKGAKEQEEEVLEESPLSQEPSPDYSSSSSVN